MVEGEMLLDQVAYVSRQILENVEKVIVGKGQVAKMILAALLSGGHVLLEDVPGTGKTMMARAFAASMRCTFKRIQFTPDLLPSDIIGVSIYNEKTSGFEFRPGPVFANVVLADEINRASPKVQSSLLECMEEGQVTVDGVVHRLPEIFFVVATENPIEQEGTYPLPESQKDRFMVRLRIGYPEVAEERRMLDLHRAGHPIERLDPVTSQEEILRIRRSLSEITVDDTVKQYIVSLVSATRRSKDLALGASPRSTISLFKLSRAMAALSGRSYVLPDDVKQLAVPVLAHRVIMEAMPKIEGTTPEEVVGTIVESVPVPISR